ncbi:MAG: hypothetical protein KatS3mg038_2430 [Candidatus Kapaibacterium sp.]|nr:MAG: hypothetical protein KatS3mg038_2430 [Candidatus Kapabacteria bacterium]
MADYYELVIYHVPTAQPRPRRGKHGAMYVPSNHPVHTFRSLIAAEFRRSHYPLLDGPIELRVSAYFPRPKRLLSKRAAPGRLPFVARTSATGTTSAKQSLMRSHTTPGETMARSSVLSSSDTTARSTSRHTCGSPGAISMPTLDVARSPRA